VFHSWGARKKEMLQPGLCDRRRTNNHPHSVGLPLTTYLSLYFLNFYKIKPDLQDKDAIKDIPNRK
jgi:hypothetical protein